jgi:hypothetical protein
MVSTNSSPEFIEAEDGTRLAFFATPATHPDPGPGVVFLGGFMSDMTGQKATVLETWAIPATASRAARSVMARSDAGLPMRSRSSGTSAQQCLD